MKVKRSERPIYIVLHECVLISHLQISPSKSRKQMAKNLVSMVFSSVRISFNNSKKKLTTLCLYRLKSRILWRKDRHCRQNDLDYLDMA